MGLIIIPILWVLIIILLDDGEKIAPLKGMSNPNIFTRFDNKD